jgi:putative SOS response-associated peptidase YedK
MDKFVSYATGPACWPGEPGAVIRRGRDGEIEMVNLIWGFAPREAGGRAITHVRSEGRPFGSRRCLIPGSEFSVASGRGRARRKWRVTMTGRDGYFYFAGIWRPAEADWPPSYALLTVAAGPDIAPSQARQVAVIRREARMAWLDSLEPQAKLLAPLPKGSFSLEQIEGPGGGRGPCRGEMVHRAIRPIAPTPWWYGLSERHPGLDPGSSDERPSRALD